MGCNCMKDIKHFNSVQEMRDFYRGKGEVIVPTEFKLEDLKKPKKKETKEKKPSTKKKGGKK